MSTPHLSRLVGVIACAAVAIVPASCSSVDNEVDLLSQLDTAEKRTLIETGPQFVLETVAIDDVSKRVVLARAPARLIYPITVPRDAWFEVAFALKPETWDLPGDGVQFRVGVSDGRVYEELLKQYINPRRGDRRWFSARLDLSAYEGRQVKLILNTDPSAAKRQDRENDLAVWAEPRIYSKR